MQPLGSFARGGGGPKVPNGMYAAVITDAHVVMEKDNPGVPLIDRYNKQRIFVKFELTDEVGEDGGPIVLNRSLPISFGMNKTSGAHSALAVLVEAALAIPAGDKAQYHVQAAQFIGKRLMVRTQNVEKEGRTYTNVVDFMGMPRQQRPRLEPIAAEPLKPFVPQHSDQWARVEEADLNDEIPFDEVL